MRRIYVEVSSHPSPRFAYVESEGGEHFVQPEFSFYAASERETPERVGPFKTVGRAMKAALMWCETGKVLYLTQ